MYVGQTEQPLKERFRQHIVACKNKDKQHLKLYDAMNEIGIDKFYIKELERNVSKDKLDEMEKYYIEKFNSFCGGYNSTVGGKGGELILEKYYNDIVDLYNSGLSCNDISEKYNVSTTTIYRILEKLNIEFRHDGNKYEHICLSEFIRLWQDKSISRKDMSDYYKLDGRTIKRIANRLGLNRKGVTTIENTINSASRVGLSLSQSEVQDIEDIV